MGYVLEESDKQDIQKSLDLIYAPTPDEDSVRDGVWSLRMPIRSTIASVGGDDADKEDAQADHPDKIPALKQYILTTKPDFFKHLIGFLEYPCAIQDSDLFYSIGGLIAEMLRNSPPCKLAFMPYIDNLFRLTFQVDPEVRASSYEIHLLSRCPIVELLRPDPNAGDVHRAAVDALSHEVKAFTDLLPSELSASTMTKGLVEKQNALMSGLHGLTWASPEPDAVLAFIEAGALDALLGALACGQLPLSDVESLNESLRSACNGLAKLLEDSSEVLAKALVERQLVAPLIYQMIHICGLKDAYVESDVPRALAFPAKWNETFRTQIVAGAQRLISSDPTDLGAGAVVVLWGLIEGAQTCNIDEINQLTQSEGYTSFFPTPCEPDMSDAVMSAASGALAHRIGQPGHQLHKEISTPTMVGKLVNLFEVACTLGEPENSSAMKVLRELVLPASEGDTGRVISLDEGLGRVNNPLCQMFSKAVKARCKAAQALASEGTAGGESEVVIQEPSEEGLANMKNVGMLKTLAGEQHIVTALLADGLLDYQRHLLTSPSALTRHAGLELLAALCHSSSPMEDFKCVPDIIETFKLLVVHMLDDSRALIRAMALRWLGGIMAYKHPKSDSESLARYKPGIDFVMEAVSEAKLVVLLKGTEAEGEAAAGMVELMAKHSRSSEVRDRLKGNRELVELLWSRAFGDKEKALPDEDEDFSAGIWNNLNIEAASGQALFGILDPLTDCADIVSHILPRLEQFKVQEPGEFKDFLRTLPAITSPAVFTQETGVLSQLSEMIANEEQLSDAISALWFLSRQPMLAKVSLGQSDHIYPALVKVLQEGTDDSKSTVLGELEALIRESTASRTRFMKEGGIKALLNIISSQNSTLWRGAVATLISFLTNFPEGARPTLDAGGVPVLELKKNDEDMSDLVGSALALLEDFKAASAVERIEFTPEAYAVLGKKLSDTAALEQLKKNLESSQDEKQLATAGGLPVELIDLLRSNSEPKLLLQVLHILLATEASAWDGYTIALRAAEQRGLWEVLQPLVENEDKEISDLAADIRRAIAAEWNNGSRKDTSGWGVIW